MLTVSNNGDKIMIVAARAVISPEQMWSNPQIVSKNNVDR